MPPKIAGIRRRMMSRVVPPPTAVMVPSRMAGSHPRSASNVFWTPVTDHRPMTAASTTTKIRFHASSEKLTRNATKDPATAIGT